MSSRERHVLLVLLGLALAAATTACGFRLQGRMPLPDALATVYVQTEDSQTDFVQSLRKSLIASGARVVPDPLEAAAVVRILEDEATRRVLSLSASNVPREYEITYSVRYAVSAGEREVLPAQEVAASRAFTFDERILLAKEHEEDILREALANDLASVVMRRLSAL
ncbi:MAG: LPS assembly lipoprotein LptE [Steroidobacteraceae bacterium]